MAAERPCIGIRREDKSIWERRVALTPANVRSLVEEHGLRVLVQPSPRRVFDDAEYAEAGAEVTEDLTPAGTILGVKEVPPSSLLPDRTYCFFSHTIKAQPYNMPLLDRLLEQRVRLVDYECITETGVRGDRRLVAFGRFAGIAGAVDFFRGLGERLLHQGFNTPMLALGSTYMYPNEAAWRAAVSACGRRIAEVGLPPELCPFVCVVTGRGNVSKGVQEILELLPHRRVAAGDAASIMEAEGRDRTHQIFIVEAAWDAMVRRRAEPGSSPSPRAADDPAASRDEFHSHPERYESVFHETLAPLASALFVCHYWEERFPRTLTVRQAQRLASAGRLRLRGVCDISCDMGGSVEFLTDFTSIERPFYVWDPATARSHTEGDVMAAPGVLYHAVDHLPSECPLEASEHFGRCLMPFVPALAASPATAPFESLGPPLLTPSPASPEAEAAAAVPAPVRGAIVTCRGAMTPQFRYITALRAAQDAASAKRAGRLRRRESFVTLRLRGHLFDTGCINRVLDVVEAVPGASCGPASVVVGRSTDHESEARMALFASGGPDNLAAALRAVAAAAREHEARVEVAGGDDDDDDGDGAASGPPLGLPSPGSGSSLVGLALDATGSDDTGIDAMVRAAARPTAPPPAHTRQGSGGAGGLRSAPPKRVLLLGAGMVTRPLVEYLLRRPTNTITVCSAVPGEAEALCAGRPRATPRDLAVDADPAAPQPELHGLVAGHDLVLSLLPAFLHVAVARACLDEGRHLVTASYVSDGMAALDAEARERGVLLLNEMGVDPGFDHMSAMRMIAAAREAGEAIVAFSSSTGGLPAPEAATNPLGYKFSWSPRGALVAARNAALYVRDGRRVAVPSAALLASAEPFRAGRGFALEVLPNRDSTKYASKYGLADSATVGTDAADCPLTGLFRGTLRYAGFSRQLLALAAIGMLDAEPAGEGHDAVLDAAAAGDASATLLAWTAAKAGAGAADADAVLDAVCGRADAVLAEAGRPPLSPEERSDIRETLAFAGLLSPSAPAPALPAARRSAVDALAAVLGPLEAMKYGDGERDMVVMQHTLVTAGPDAGRRTERTGLMVEYARDGDSAMARTVGLTAAIGAQLVLDGAVRLTGVRTPVEPELYEPVLDGLEGEGIAMAESSRRLA